MRDRQGILDRSRRLRPMPHERARLHWLVLAPLTVALAVILALAACGAPPPGPDPEPEQRVAIDGFETSFTRIRSRGATAIDCDAVGGGSITVTEFVGRTGQGATYFHYTPNQDWNGDLVLYARGYVPPGQLSAMIAAFLLGGELPRAVQDVLDLRDALLCAGYAVALSGYAADGYAVEEGFRDTHLLGPLFAWHGDAPDRTFLLGHSMGALIVTALVESFPVRYEGAMATCGPVGGSVLQMDYIGNVRLVFDRLFPGVIDGDVLTPTEQTFDEVVAAIEQAIIADPITFAALAAVHVAGLAPGGAVSLLRYDPDDPAFETIAEALARALYYEVLGKEDVLERGGGGLPFDNTAVTYFTDASLGPELAGIPAYEADPDALAYFGDWYGSRGSLSRPLRLVHSEFDADVPAYHVDAYLAGLDASSRLLVQDRVIAGDTSHCALSAAQIFGEFQLLLDAVP